MLGDKEVGQSGDFENSVAAEEALGPYDRFDPADEPP